MKLPEFCYIYGLKDPRDEQIHYIGKANDPDRRFYDHLKDDSTNADRVAWIADLEREGCTPELVILEKVTMDEWREAERYWIAKGREEGWPLTNIKDGGDGNDAWIPPNYEYMRWYLGDDLMVVFEKLGIRERDSIIVQAAQAAVLYPADWNLFDMRRYEIAAKEARAIVSGYVS